MVLKISGPKGPMLLKTDSDHGFALRIGTTRTEGRVSVLIRPVMARSRGGSLIRSRGAHHASVLEKAPRIRHLAGNLTVTNGSRHAKLDSQDHSNVGFHNR